MGQGWGPEGWPGGGTGSGRRRLGAVKPAFACISSCRAACPCPQAESYAQRGHLGIILEPRAGQPWSPQHHCHRSALLEPTPGSCGLRCRARGEGEPQRWHGMDGTDLGTGGKGPGPGQSMPTSGPLRWLLHMDLREQGWCPPPCKQPLPMSTVGLPQRAIPQPNAWHGPGAHCLNTGRFWEPVPHRRLPAEALGRASSWPQIPQGDMGTRKGEIAPFQHQAAGQKWVQPFNPVAKTPSPHWYRTSPSTSPCPALCVGPTSTSSLPAAMSPCPAPHTLLPQLLAQLLP